MKRRFAMIAAGITAVLQGNGCEHAFEPKGPYDEQMVVYCYLSTSANSVLARVYSTYDPPAFDPYTQTEDTPIEDASVSLTTQATTIPFRDTTFVRPDSTRYGSQLIAFVADPVEIQFGQTYMLEVFSPTRGHISSIVKVPSHGVMTVSNLYKLDDPARYEGESVIVTCQFAPETFGYLIRALLQYEWSEGGNLMWGIEEVPLNFSHFSEGTYSDPVYPRARRRAVSSSSSSGESLNIGVTMFAITASKIRIQKPGATMRNVIFVLTQIEQSLYTYYSVANGFQDERSIRLDDPDYSNLADGIGLFGAFAEDSTIYPLRNGL